MKGSMMIPLLLAFGFFLVGIVTLPDYGLNWDAPGHFLQGQAYAELFLNRRWTFVQSLELSPILVKPGETMSRYYFNAWETASNAAPLPDRVLLRREFEEFQQKTGSRQSFYEHQAWNGEAFLGFEDTGHPPHLDILAALSNRLFYQKLGWIGDIESYQLLFIFIAALGVFIVSRFAWDLTSSRFASLAAGLSLALFPLYFADSHIDVKGPASAVFYAGCVWTFWNWVMKNRKRWMVGFAIFFALALGVKWAIVTLPMVIGSWLIVMRKTQELQKWISNKKQLLMSLLVVLVISATWFVGFWPHLWSNPIERTRQLLFGFYLSYNSNTVLQPEGWVWNGMNFYPLVLLVGQTPEVVLGLGAVGVVGVMREKKKRRSVGALLLFWFLIPVARMVLFGTRAHGGVRQFTEVIPAMAVLAGVGTSVLSQKLKFKIQNYNSKVKSFKALLHFNLYFCLLTFAFLLYPVIRLHPNENVYFNSLVGGLKGASKKNLIDWTLTYGNAYKQGVAWLNDHAEPDAKLAHLDGSMLAISPLWLRPDISFSPDHFSGFDQEGEYIMVFPNPLDPPVFAKRFPERFLTPVHEIVIEGVPILSVYQNVSSRSTMPLMEKEIDVKGRIKQTVTPNGNFWEVDLGNLQRVTRMMVKKPPSTCLSIQGDFISFVPDALRRNAPEAIYVLNEKSSDGNHDVEFLFPGEEGRILRIFPQGEETCTGSGVISTVSVLDQ